MSARRDSFTPTIDQLRRYAIARSLFEPTSLSRAVARLGFVQADPMRAPARAQDLILAHRVAGYRAGDLERRYPTLAIEEAFFINYGFLTRDAAALLHPRRAPRSWDAGMKARSRRVLAFVRERGPAHSKHVQERFRHGSIRRWGGDLNLGAHLLEGLHYRGLLRVERREAGARIYRAVESPERQKEPEARSARAARLVDILVGLYAPLPAASLGYLCALLRSGVPHLAAEIRKIRARALSRYAHADVGGVVWLWPSDEKPAAEPDALGGRLGDRLRFLTPFDPVVWDRRRFQLLWDWEYKFEAYLPSRERRMGHYAMPLLWGERVIGWANLKVVDRRLQHEIGFAGRRPRERAFGGALEEALERMRQFLGLPA